MARGKAITDEIVAEVKQLKREYPQMGSDKIAKFAGTSVTSVNRILAGRYDEKHDKKDAKGSDYEDLLLAVMEQNEKLDEALRLMKSMMLALAVIIDPKSGKTSAPVADAIRSAVRGGDD